MPAFNRTCFQKLLPFLSPEEERVKVQIKILTSEKEALGRMIFAAPLPAQLWNSRGSLLTPFSISSEAAEARLFRGLQSMVVNSENCNEKSSHMMNVIHWFDLGMPWRYCHLYKPLFYGLLILSCKQVSVQPAYFRAMAPAEKDRDAETCS